MVYCCKRDTEYNVIQYLVDVVGIKVQGVPGSHLHNHGARPYFPRRLTPALGPPPTLLQKSPTVRKCDLNEVSIANIGCAAVGSSVIASGCSLKSPCFDVKGSMVPIGEVGRQLFVRDDLAKHWTLCIFSVSALDKGGWVLLDHSFNFRFQLVLHFQHFIVGLLNYSSCVFRQDISQFVHLDPEFFFPRLKV